MYGRSVIDISYRSELVFIDTVVFVLPQVLAADAGEYCLVFDNSYSWFKPKQIYYWYHVASGDNSTSS